MASAATQIGDALAQADPANAETYKKNAATTKSQMEALSKKLVDGTAKCQHKEFVTSHEAFGYLADRTGLTQLGLSGLDPESTPSPLASSRFQTRSRPRESPQSSPKSS